MNSHFQSSETTCTSPGFSGELIGLKGSRSCDPIQITPPRNRMTRIGMPQTTISMLPEYTKSGWEGARVLDSRNHQPKARIAMIVGTTVTSMIPSALSRIFAFAAPIGPCASSTPPEQPLTQRRMTSAAENRQGRGRRFKRNAAHHDMEAGNCMKMRVRCGSERDVGGRIPNIAALRVAGPGLASKAGGIESGHMSHARGQI